MKGKDTGPGPVADRMRNLKLTLAYDGTEFSGWQSQPDRRTVQGVVESAFASLTGETSSVQGSGRTDAGVHARGQVAHVHTATRHPTAVVLRALNALLPRDVRVLAVEEATQAFHATFDAVSKRYGYEFDDGAIFDPFRLRQAWAVGRWLDVEAMGRAAGSLLGRHDFRCFETNWPNRLSSVRTIFDATAIREGPSVARVEVEADGFLYNMVRAIAGTLLYVGLGKRPETWVADVIRDGRREGAGPTAPPQGLSLLHVRYDRRAPLDP